MYNSTRLKLISTKGLSQNQLAAGEDRRIYHGIISARDAIQCAKARNLSCGIADLDLVAAFNMVSMLWIAMVLRAKGLSQVNTDRFLNMYRDAAIRVVVNNEVGKEIKVKRCVRQGAPPSILLFLYNVAWTRLSCTWRRKLEYPVRTRTRCCTYLVLRQDT